VKRSGNFQKQPSLFPKMKNFLQKYVDKMGLWIYFGPNFSRQANSLLKS